MIENATGAPSALPALRYPVGEPYGRTVRLLGEIAWMLCALSLMAWLVHLGFARMRPRFGGWQGMSPDEAIHVGVSLPGLLIMLGLCVLVHELGHAIGGRLVGFRLFRLMVGPVGVQNSVSHGWHPILSKRLSSLLGGGYTLTLPIPGDERPLRLRWIVMVAAGAGSNLLIAILAVMLSLGCGLAGMHAHAGYVAQATSRAAWQFAELSTLVALTALLPFRLGVVRSDGARILTLLWNGPGARAHLAVCALTGAAAAGEPPHAWSSSAVQDLAAEGHKASLSALLMSYYRALDCDRPSDAHRYLQRALDLMPGSAFARRAGLELEAAWFEAHYRGALSNARRWLDRGAEAGGGLEETRARAMVAIACAAGQPERGRRLLDQALSQGDGDSADRGLHRYLLERLTPPSLARPYGGLRESSVGGARDEACAP